MNRIIKACKSLLLSWSLKFLRLSKRFLHPGTDWSYFLFTLFLLTSDKIRTKVSALGTKLQPQAAKQIAESRVGWN